MRKPTIIHSEIPTPYRKKVPVIPFGNEQQYRGKHPTIYSAISLKIETRNMHKLKSQKNLPSKYKESTRFPQ